MLVDFAPFRFHHVLALLNSMFFSQHSIFVATIIDVFDVFPMKSSIYPPYFPASHGRFATPPGAFPVDTSTGRNSWFLPSTAWSNHSWRVSKQTWGHLIRTWALGLWYGMILTAQFLSPKLDGLWAWNILESFPVGGNFGQWNEHQMEWASFESCLWIFGGPWPSPTWNQL